MTSREVFGACGAAFAIDRGLFVSLGGFDEDFFMVYEDVDLSYRASPGIVAGMQPTLSFGMPGAPRSVG